MGAQNRALGLDSHVRQHARGKVLIGMEERLPHHLLHRPLIDAIGRLDPHIGSDTGAELFRTHLENAIGIEEKLDLDLRNACWECGNARELDTRQRAVVLR